MSMWARLESSMAEKPMAMLLGTSLLSFLTGCAWMRWRGLGSKGKGKGNKAAGEGGGARGYNEDEEDEYEDNLPSDGYASFGIKDGPAKLVLVVNQSLKMGKGKMAAQCCHATLGCFKLASNHAPDAVRTWEWLGQAKIAVKCPTEEEMLNIQAVAKAAGLVTYLVRDAGRTQIASGSQTVLGIGPAPVTAFEGITSHLSLM